MSRRTVLVPVLATWQPTDTLNLYIGDEDAADLASSASTSKVASIKVGNASTGDRIPISFSYSPNNICAQLPIGVSSIDAAGNESDEFEALMDLKEPPLPPGRPDVAATANPGEATLTWLASASFVVVLMVTNINALRLYLMMG